VRIKLNKAQPGKIFFDLGDTNREFRGIRFKALRPRVTSQIETQKLPEGIDR